MKILIRTDASVHIGTGHVIRCLTLADRLRPHAEISFVCRELEGNLISFIRSRGYGVYPIPPAESNWETDAEFTLAYVTQEKLPIDWLIIDHYGLEAKYESVLRPHAKRVLVIDDLADRSHRCDLLLDQNPYRDGNKRYEGLVEESCTMLLGPKYALLRPEFAREREYIWRSGDIRSILVSFGGADMTGETMKTLQALEPLLTDKVKVKVLMGKINSQAERIREMCLRLNQVECFDHVDDVATLMREADLAIGSGGTTTWERCCLGLPAIVIMTADNQVELSENASELGVISLLGRAEQVQAAHIRDRVLGLMHSTAEMTNMSVKGTRLVDGLGVDRTVKELLKC
ncbi:UDP-2,4-diacetamido-2,4,6-trideoxy-beta-L-altropyranose hydrolase [Cohnella silvisoli]|uniref:UDP-2,4-diacetamido-2,4, 6-trideoxy-beta-L-altropyranose hydrolase n=1 Tax=Cohnella silvisoli TaxID=2873699 RepID=A0ABV1KVX4_9BACL|nr:UDP-2,4-diacetamido-2,4,6-trideoxy-beta-L-altropyranose hydrolase [Cohnella silvisoli]MCD9023663.1 UDP-2,4-diacetamido-2,4,6-trideoxy-beta-L-altropyranose hydrolase [Cohnella silvisoli]